MIFVGDDSMTQPGEVVYAHDLIAAAVDDFDCGAPMFAGGKRQRVHVAQPVGWGCRVGFGSWGILHLPVNYRWLRFRKSNDATLIESVSGEHLRRNCLNRGLNGLCGLHGLRDFVIG